jgi:hypothetical protein
MHLRALQILTLRLGDSWNVGHNVTVGRIEVVLCNRKYNQQEALYGLIYYSKSTLHVSGDIFAHHQEHLTVFTVSGSVHPSCCRLPNIARNT